VSGERVKTRWTRSEVDQLLASQRKEPTVYDKIVALDESIANRVSNIIYMRSDLEREEDRLREMKEERAVMAEALRQQLFR